MARSNRHFSESNQFKIILNLSYCTVFSNLGQVNYWLELELVVDESLVELDDVVELDDELVAYCARRLEKALSLTFTFASSSALAIT